MAFAGIKMVISSTVCEIAPTTKNSNTTSPGHLKPSLSTTTQQKTRNHTNENAIIVLWIGRRRKLQSPTQYGGGEQ